MIPERKMKMKTKDVNKLRRAVADLVGVEVSRVSIENYNANNNVSKIGMTIHKGSRTTLPVVYIDSIIDQWNHGRSIQWASNEVVRLYRMAMDELEKIPDVKLTREAVLERSFIRVINADKNAAMLAAAPHRLFADLAAVCRIRIMERTDKEYSILVTWSILEKYGIGEEEIFHTASENTIQDGFECLSMEDFIRRGTGDTYDTGGRNWMYVATRKGDKAGGASLLAFPDIIGQFVSNVCPNSERALIIPSSIHEIIICVDDVISTEALKIVVGDMNKAMNPTEILSDNVYEFDTERKELRVAS